MRRTLLGVVVDEKGQAVVGMTVTAQWAGGRQQVKTDTQGRFTLEAPVQPITVVVSGQYVETNRTAVAAGVKEVQIRISYELPRVEESLVITAEAADPAIDRRNDTIYKSTLFLRDDQLFETLDGGINAGQHEGGGKSIEVRRFGFNLDHGGANGGLKVLVDDVPQNQATQAHGQGYLGALKSLSPELVEDVDILNGPFRAEYGDFSALGVVHIRLKERLENAWTLRAQGGSFGGYRTFAAWSPQGRSSSGVLAWEHAFTNGPFINPLHYVRDNGTGSVTRRLDARQTMGAKFNAGRNDFDSSGQIPLDLVLAGTMNRFGYMDPTDGGRVRSTTASAYYKREVDENSTLRADGFINRSLFDLFSDFTFYLNDPAHGDGIQQHDSRLQTGGSVQQLRAWRVGSVPALLTAGGNITANWINVDLYHAEARKIVAPVEGIPQTLSSVRLANPAVYLQQGFDWPHIHLDAGLRLDSFRFSVTDRSAGITAEDWKVAAEPKANAVYKPVARWPLELHLNYGRAVTSQDARALVANSTAPQIAATNFTMLGVSHSVKSISASADVFLIDRQHENVYDADNGTMEYQGPSRSYGWEAKASGQLTPHWSANAGLTQVSNAFFRGTRPREYVDSAPHTVANASVTLNGWRGLYASLRYRHVGHYLLVNPDNPADSPAVPYSSGTTALASGLDVIDLAASGKLRAGIEWNFSVDNLNDKRYWETQNLFNSRVTPESAAEARVHGTPGYSAGVMVGLTWRFE
ncbi:MAG: TonB-dependent receptor [Terracidiphilus sp.]|nr:TonB-dependent receptor [Terracidiphilus sp.]